MTGVLAFIGRSTFGLLRYASSPNLKHFTPTIKQQPFSLIRIKTQKDREPPLGK